MPFSPRARARLARTVLLCQAAALIMLGLAYWVRPQEMANLAGILLMDGSSVGLMRAWLGAMPLLLAALLWRAQAEAERLPAALAMVAAGSAALVLTRLISLGLAPGALLGFDVLCLLWWLASAALAGASWWLLREPPDERVKSPRRPLPLEPPQPFRRGEAHSPASTADGAVVAFRRGEPVDPLP